MGYSIQSAKYANPEGTSVVAQTLEAGAVAISENDRPVLWRTLQTWVAAGGVISGYVAQQVTKEVVVSELIKLLVSKGLVTQADIDAAAK